MAEKSKLAAETEAYLAKIRKTVRESKNLVESVRLRLAETDRMLESEGLTREDVAKFSFNEAQKAAVNEELERMGLARIDDEDDFRSEYGERRLESGMADDASVRGGACAAGANFSAGDGDGSVENRKRKFNVMMQQFRM
jgi:acetyl-CoA acetyltransferase